MVKCSSAIAPSYDGPYCSSLHLPSCTYKQYTEEAVALHKALPGVQSVGPLDVEEHMAADYNCGISAAMIPRYSTATMAVNVAYGFIAPLVFVIFGLLIYAYLHEEKR